MRLLFFVALLPALLAGPGQAQTRPSDVILRTSGEEVRGRVLTVSPAQISYLAAPDSARAAAPDTLRLPAASVFLVRYANGTRELIQPPAGPAADPAGALLAGLSPAQRYQRGQADSRTDYRGGGAFAGTLGSTLLFGLAGPVTGLVTAAVVSSTPLPAHRLLVPGPVLMSDPSYASGYRQQGRRTKSRRAWGGYGIGMGAEALLIMLLVGTYR